MILKTFSKRTDSFHKFHAFFNFNIGLFVKFLYEFLYGDNYISASCWFNTRKLDWQQECREQSIAEVLQSEDALLINDSDGEITDNVTNVTASETFDIMDAVKCFAEIYGGKQMNVMLIELIGKMKTFKLQNFRQSTIRMFFKNKVVLPMIIFSSKNSKFPYSGHLLIAYIFFRNRSGPL